VSYLPHFWCSRAISKARDSCWCYLSLVKNSSFSCFMAILRVIAHNVRVLVRYRRHMIVNAFFKPWPTTRRFCMLWPFLWAIDHNFGVQGQFTWHVKVGSFFRAMSKTSHFMSYICFRELLPIILEFRCDLQGTRQFMPFLKSWPVGGMTPGRVKRIERYKSHGWLYAGWPKEGLARI
jgi:hypothetical protein